MEILPMFPLETVLLPGEVLPLQIFEPRYVALLQAALAGSPRFGVVMIERGSEVGGGEVRSNYGTVARIAEATEGRDGRWYVATRGTNRISVVRWLDDDPYPVAEVLDWHDSRTDETDASLLAEATRLVRACLARRTELGEDVVPATFDRPEDPSVASFLLASLGALGVLDRQRILGAPDPDSRLRLLVPLLQARLADLDDTIGGR